MAPITRRQATISLAATTGLAAAGLAALPARAAPREVTIKSFAFQPAELNVAVGDTVTFTNQDGAPHTATADGGAFDTGTLKKGASGSLTFSAKGKFAYHCEFHRNMKGTITVG